MNQVLEILGPSTSVIYPLGRMNNFSESTESIMVLDENLVRADSPNSAQPSVSIRSGHFTGVLYAIERVIFTLSRLWLEELRRFYQILESVSLRVFAFDEWASSCLPNGVSIFE